MVLQSSGLIKLSELRAEYGRPPPGTMILLGKYHNGGQEYGVKPAGAPNVTATPSNLIRLGNFYGAFKVLPPALPSSLPSWTGNSSTSTMYFYAASYQSANATYVGPLSWSASPSASSLSINASSGALTMAQFGMLNTTLTITASGQGGSASSTLAVNITSYDPPVFVAVVQQLTGNTYAGPVYMYASSYLVNASSVGPLTCSLTGAPAGVSVDGNGTIIVDQGVAVPSGSFTITVSGYAGSAGSKLIPIYILSEPEVPRIFMPSAPFQHYTDTTFAPGTVINTFYLQAANGGASGPITWSLVRFGIQGYDVIVADAQIKVLSKGLAYPYVVVRATGPTGLYADASIPCYFFPDRTPRMQNVSYPMSTQVPVSRGNGYALTQHNPFATGVTYGVVSQTGTANLAIYVTGVDGCSFQFDTNNQGSITVIATGPDGGTDTATMTVV